MLLASATLAVAGCQDLLPPPELVNPLSKVYVNNQTDTGYYVRMNWPDGFVQVSWIEPETTVGLSGAIGTTGFPDTLDVLEPAECDLVASVRGLRPGSVGIVIIAPGADVTLHHLDRAHSSWAIEGGQQECGATPP